jgi:hypothetical protein
VILSPFILVPLSAALYFFLLPTMWPALVPYLIWYLNEHLHHCTPLANRTRLSPQLCGGCVVARIVFFDKAPTQGGRPSHFFRTLRIWNLFKYDCTSTQLSTDVYSLCCNTVRNQ